MPTSACGINCDVCKLNVIGVCSSCGSGISVEAEKKIAAQIRLFGQPCPILSCAFQNKIEYCLRDCRQFPCDNFKAGPYPFSQGYLHMQNRRRNLIPVGKSPHGGNIEVPDEFWYELLHRNLPKICDLAEASLVCPHEVSISFLNRTIKLNLDTKELYQDNSGSWEKIDSPVLTLLFLIYLRKAEKPQPTQNLISINELKNTRFFTGQNAIDSNLLKKRFGRDPFRFQEACLALNAEPVNMGDFAYRFNPFPKIPLYYLLWIADDEFDANISVLFDKTIEHYFPAELIWGLVNLVSDLLLLDS